jgi:hypothetical protein
LKQASEAVSEYVQPARPEAESLEQPSNGNGKYAFHIPQYAGAWSDDDERPAESAESSVEQTVPSLDELLDFEIGRTAAAEQPAGTSELEQPLESESSGIGHILDASLADDGLDIALPAELIDPEELDGYSSGSDQPHPLHDDALDQQPRRG